MDCELRVYKFQLNNESPFYPLFGGKPCRFDAPSGGGVVRYCFKQNFVQCIQAEAIANNVKDVSDCILQNLSL
jgi:hypothetical protein